MEPRERELLSAWEHGDSDAGLLLADWLFLDGQEERSAGVRWLVEREKRPQSAGGKFWWYRRKHTYEAGISPDRTARTFCERGSVVVVIAPLS